MNKKMTRDQKEKQVRKEARATFILFVICFLWNVGFAYGLSGTGIRIGGLPLWWIVSVPGVFVVAVIGVVYLLKKVFVNFELDDEPVVVSDAIGRAAKAAGSAVVAGAVSAELNSSAASAEGAAVEEGGADDAE